MPSLNRDTVLAQLRAEDVAAHLGITGSWRGRWLRSRRCAATDHPSDAFGLARDGMWHCHACDKGGDLLALVAVGEGLDVRTEFPEVLKIAAAIAGVDNVDDFGSGAVKPPPKARPAPPALLPIADRIANAKRRAAWVWSRLVGREDMAHSSVDNYLTKWRGLDAAIIRRREELREAPLRCTPEERTKSEELARLSKIFAVPGVALPVRALTDGRLVDVRIRRYEPREGQPKIVGMLGGVTTAPAEAGRPRKLVGCYGHPELINADLVVCVEGAFDYLSGLQVWPGAAVLGATDAGSLALVVAHAARELAGRDQRSRLLIVEQNDPPRTLHDGRVVAGAADASVNEDPNAATKVAMRILGSARVGWLFCSLGDGIKDLNDLVIAAGSDVPGMVRWWSDGAPP
jgi:hypothetical protein